MKILILTVLFFLSFGCTNSNNKAPGQNIKKDTTDKPAKVSKDEIKDFGDIMRISLDEAVIKYGKPFIKEAFILEDNNIHEFRVGLYNIYSKTQVASKTITIEEVTWRKDSLNNITVWYEKQQKKNIPKDHLVWDKNTEF